MSPNFLLHLQVFDTSPKKPIRNLQKPIFHRGVEYGLKALVRHHFQWRKTTIGWLQRATWKKRYRIRRKSIALLQNCKMKWKRFIVVLESKTMLLCGKIDKIVQFNSLFLGNSYNFYLCPWKADDFFILVLKRLFV